MIRKPDRVRPVKLEGNSVLPSEALPEVHFAPRDCLSVDWERTLDLANFKPEEVAFIHTCHLGGLTCLQAATALNWTPSKARRVQRRIQRRLASGPILTNVPILPMASGVTFLEKLPSGRQTWAMSRPNPIEPIIMRRERKTLFLAKSITYKNV